VLTYPLLYCMLLATVLSACLFLFISVKRDLAWAEAELNQRIHAVEGETVRLAANNADTSAKVERLSARISTAEEKLDLFAPARAGVDYSQGIDLNQRTQVLRRARRGDRPEQAAAELGLPKSEVDLLYKVHRAVVKSF